MSMAGKSDGISPLLTITHISDVRGIAGGLTQGVSGAVVKRVDNNPRPSDVTKATYTGPTDQPTYVVAVGKQTGLFGTW